MHDSYDPSVAFDDVYDGRALDDAVRKRTQGLTAVLLRQIAAGRIAAPPMSFVPTTHDTSESFAVPGHRDKLLDANNDLTKLFPIYSELLKKYQAAVPAPKLVRIDTPESYRDFRDSRRVKYILGFDADPSEQALKAADKGGLDVPVALPPWAKDKVECWQDGDEVLSSIRVPSPDGTVRHMTTGSPVRRHAEEAMVAARQSQVAPEDCLVVVALLAPTLGCGSLIPQMCCAYPEVFSRPDVVAKRASVGIMASPTDPAFAAMMALVQMGQAGDEGARRELREMSVGGLGNLVGEAVERVAQAQAVKARRLH